MKTLFLASTLLLLNILGVNAQTENAGQSWTPTIEFEKLKHNFGSIPEGPKAEYDFNFTNTGSEPVIVITAQAGCGCTTPEWPRHNIEPGKTAQIKVGYNSGGRPGSFSKDVNVTFAPADNNEKQGSLKLTIIGDVIPTDNTKPKEGNAIIIPADTPQKENQNLNKGSRNVLNSPIPQ